MGDTYRDNGGERREAQNAIPANITQTKRLMVELRLNTPLRRTRLKPRVTALRLPVHRTPLTNEAPGISELSTSHPVIYRSQSLDLLECHFRPANSRQRAGIVTGLPNQQHR